MAYACSTWKLILSIEASSWSGRFMMKRLIISSHETRRSARDRRSRCDEKTNVDSSSKTSSR